MNIVALAGGVGGAKLADGLQRVAGDSLTVIVNTADDFELHGLYISPDLDTVMYALAGIANPETGWGIAGDTFNNLEMISRYGAENWFQLGDRDLATHLVRTQMLRRGNTLTQATSYLARSLGVPATILPMANERVATVIESDEGNLTFQDYFVRHRWQPFLRAIRLDGIERARPSLEVLRAIDRADAIIVGPSNPFVSIAPILAVPSLRENIHAASAIKIAVTPIVGGEALKGPAAKMFREMNLQPSALAVAQHYRGVVERFVLDRVDEGHAPAIKDLGMRVWVTDTVMRNELDRERLAQEIVDWVMR
jgi:LPPG:FO 2-phospho-L-lactate transferase